MVGFGLHIDVLTDSLPGSAGLAADWSDTANPNGVWSYGGLDTGLLWGSGFDLLSVHQSAWLPGDLGANQPAWADTAGGFPGWFKSKGTGLWDCPSGKVACHTPTVLKWTSTHTGQINISGSLWPLRNLGRTINWELKHNQTVISGGLLQWGSTSGNPQGFETGSGGSVVLSRSVKEGDVIELRFYKAGTYDDFVGVNMYVSYNY